MNTPMPRLPVSQRDLPRDAQSILELAARSAFAPQAGASLWKKMAQASGGSGGPKFLSTHPSGPDRIRELEANAPKVQSLYDQARKAG